MAAAARRTSLRWVLAAVVALAGAVTLTPAASAATDGAEGSAMGVLAASDFSADAMGGRAGVCSEAFD